MESQIKILLVDANETFTAQLSSVLGQNPAFVSSALQTTANAPWSFYIASSRTC